MKNTPIERHLIDETINEFQIVDFSKATIREVKAIASKAETASGVEFIKMEMGVPGLPPSAVGVKAEIEALQNGIASLYPDINGLPELKKEASNFIKAFINVDLSPEGCVPVTGSMQGTFASFLTCSQCDEKKDTILFIDPGFPVQKQQLVVMGQKFETFDVYDYRGEKLKEKLESYLKKGNISAIIYSNPNNPSWICLKEEELKTLRRTRFMDDASAEASVTGSVQEVLDERLREMGAFWRFYDVKRLNGAENAGIYVRRKILTDPTDLSTRVQLEIAPDDPRWALPFYTFEAATMGWEQNGGWE